MTFKEQRFCSEYVKHNHNGSEAARAAGYSEHTAAEIASENIRKPHIKEEIERLEDIRSRDLAQEFKDLAGAAKRVLGEMLESDETPPSVKAKVAKDLLDYGGYKPADTVNGSLSFYDEIEKQRKKNKGD